MNQQNPGYNPLGLLNQEKLLNTQDTGASQTSRPSALDTLFKKSNSTPVASQSQTTDATASQIMPQNRPAPFSGGIKLNLAAKLLSNQVSQSEPPSMNPEAPIKKMLKISNDMVPEQEENKQSARIQLSDYTNTKEPVSLFNTFPAQNPPRKSFDRMPQKIQEPLKKTPNTKVYEYSKQNKTLHKNIFDSTAWRSLLEYHQVNVREFEFSCNRGEYSRLPEPFSIYNAKAIRENKFVNEKLESLAVVLTQYRIHHDSISLTFRDFSGEISASSAKKWFTDRIDMPDESDQMVEESSRIMQFDQNQPIYLKIGSAYVLRNVACICPPANDPIIFICKENVFLVFNEIDQKPQ